MIEPSVLPSDPHTASLTNLSYQNPTRSKSSHHNKLKLTFDLEDNFITKICSRITGFSRLKYAHQIISYLLYSPAFTPNISRLTLLLSCFLCSIHPTVIPLRQEDMVIYHRVSYNSLSCFAVFLVAMKVSLLSQFGLTII